MVIPEWRGIILTTAEGTVICCQDKVSGVI